MSIAEIIDEYRNKIDYLDLEILIAHSLGKTREFVLIHPETKLTSHQSSVISKKIQRRMRDEPIAYILGRKEFYGLNFVVNRHTLVPRPETEQMVDMALDLLRSMPRNKLRSNATVIDVGTGSGCIAISIAKKMTDDGLPMTNHDFYATDINREALKIARKNSKINGVDKKIKFLHGSLLDPLIKNHQSSVISHQSLIITANLPYLSREIYNSAPVDVKKFEPKSALYSAEDGLAHYRKLLEQIKRLLVLCPTQHVECFMEISPEQKKPITKLAGSILPSAEIEFKKDLAGKWRICKINL